MPATDNPRRLPLLGGTPTADARAHAAAGPRIDPRTVRLSLTDRCDLACVYCRPSRSDGYFEERMADEAWHAMIKALLVSGVRRIRITGGEPLLHPRVVAMVRYLASQPEVLDLALTTN